MRTNLTPLDPVDWSDLVEVIRALPTSWHGMHSVVAGAMVIFSSRPSRSRLFGVYVMCFIFATENI